jgi:hypothetical protein
MRLFSCKVRLAGSLNNEVAKIGVTAPEISVLRVIHSPPSETGSIDPAVVTEIKAHGEIARSDTEERQRLHELYGASLKKKEQTVAAMFGVGVPLPKTVPGLEDEVIPDEPVKRTRRGRKSEEIAADVIAAVSETENEAVADAG